MDRDELLRQLAILGDQYSAVLDIGHARHTGVWPLDLAAMLVERDDAATRILAECRERLADAIMAAIEAARLLALPVAETPPVPTGSRDGEPVTWDAARFGDKVTGIFEPPSPDDRHWLVIAQSYLLIWVRNKRSSELAMSTSVNADRWNQIAPTRGWTDAPEPAQESAPAADGSGERMVPAEGVAAPEATSDAPTAVDREARILRLALALHDAQGPFPWDETSKRTREERLAVADVLIRLVSGDL